MATGIHSNDHDKASDRDSDNANANANSSHRLNTHYPFAAIVGQEDLKLCLILCAIDPTIGGVLIRGDKGTAKSTAARGLAKLLPPIRVARDPESGALDPYNLKSKSVTTSTSSSTPAAEHGEDGVDAAGVADTSTRTTAFQDAEIATPFVDLPIGATEDRVLGSIDFSATLKGGGKPVFAPGLLAAANRGILYIDEVNLLPAHLVDVLLDAAASGVNTVQREGLTLSHPARFVLIGTMNPEEGDLRPQLLDRFGLMCDVVAPRDVAVRASVVRERIAFEGDPGRFRERWNESERRLSERIRDSRDRLPRTIVPDGFLELISRICVEFRVASLRADITLYKTAAALAAWHGRTTVERDDIKQAAKWVLAHRKQRNPFDAPSPPPPSEQQQRQPDQNNKSNNSPEDDLMDQILNAPPTTPPPPESEGSAKNDGTDQNPQQPEGYENDDDNRESHDNGDHSNNDRNSSSNNNNNEGDDDGNGDDRNMHTFTASKPEQIKRLQLGKQQIKGQAGTGRRNTLPSNASRNGHYVRSAPTDKPVDLALDATLRSAAANGLDLDTGMPIVRPENYRRKVRLSTTDTLILFVVDASGSMSARQRMETIKGAVLALLTDAYQQRDRVGVIAFRGPRAEVLLPPTRSVELAEKQLQRLPTGGRTPLAHALSLTHETIHRVCRNEPDQAILLIVLSDGKANVPLPDDSSSVSGSAWEQTEHMAVRLSSLAVPTLFIDTDAGHVRVGRGKELAELLCADYLQLEDLSSDGLVHTIRQIKN
uniref:Magnesium-chelatase subunit ChlD, chloroplastic n=1 Tax=Pseudo-nitzschia australis TaxID=44445 RepID=A0A7S4EHT7_9STRA|mmetsp:Transcript_16805/g.36676  ORF Transcript_16805/g.36676 Transcript_16805/m.36676 type:complete len:768 (-) Transcript_16805:161-2464(-)|eukprot:CAMPEP_0168168794 /NCGR_PEP_ID=MMETSP0139_2-20121125/3295_1 /TAXON_ID=44445 /ORGANISM="Pseudo-nitzschia australis, Strain 10249 10 AB" /LENGTH=767 /DNA_ID=CAMNT_0008086171 /DNA_START=40 /DNA_END=2343 /DNA_ORIENTATION=-